jgi:hypothetical protein
VPHGCLGCTGRYAILAEVGAEGVSEGVQVDGATAFIALWDGSRRQVAVRDPEDATRHRKGRLIKRG